MADVRAANVFEEALARGWRGELYLGEPVSFVEGCKVRRTIAAAVRYTSIILRSVVSRHRLHIGQPVLLDEWSVIYDTWGKSQ